MNTKTQNTESIYISPVIEKGWKLGYKFTDNPVPGQCDEISMDRAAFILKYEEQAARICPGTAYMLFWESARPRPEFNDNNN